MIDGTPGGCSPVIILDCEFGLRRLQQIVTDNIRHSVRRDRKFEPSIERVSRYLWPWREAWLVRMAFLVAALDFLSTYALLDLSNKPDAYERGILASRALQIDGFRGLLIMNLVAVGTICLVAIGAKLVYSRFGYHGFARAGFVAAILPYTLAASLAAVNNVVRTMI